MNLAYAMYRPVCVIIEKRVFLHRDLFPPAQLTISLCQIPLICQQNLSKICKKVQSRFFVSDVRLCYHCSLLWALVGVFFFTQDQCSDPKEKLRIKVYIDKFWGLCLVPAKTSSLSNKPLDALIIALGFINGVIIASIDVPLLCRYISLPPSPPVYFLGQFRAQNLLQNAIIKLAIYTKNIFLLQQLSRKRTALTVQMFTFHEDNFLGKEIVNFEK